MQNSLLSDQQQALLWQALQEPPADGGLWTGVKVANWMSELLGREIAPQRGWEYLKGLEYVRRRPRPEHEQSSLLEQEQWKKADATPRCRRAQGNAHQANWYKSFRRCNAKILLQQ